MPRSARSQGRGKSLRGARQCPGPFRRLAKLGPARRGDRSSRDADARRALACPRARPHARGRARARPRPHARLRASARPRPRAAVGLATLESRTPCCARRSAWAPQASPRGLHGCMLHAHGASARRHVTPESSARPVQYVSSSMRCVAIALSFHTCTCKCRAVLSVRCHARVACTV